MNDHIIDLAIGKPLTDKMLQDMLYEICADEHSSCNSACPVYALNHNSPPGYKRTGECSCFKNGQAMLNFVRVNVA